MNADSFHGYQHAGLALTPLGDWCLNQAIEDWPGLRLVGCILAATLLLRGTHLGIKRARARRRLQRTPAAPDNQPGTDIDALIVCRGIDREPLRDGDIQRRAIRYLREKGDETP
jgi:hypothetical protein